MPETARAAGPIRIGVIAEAQSVAGAAIPKAVQLGAGGRQIQVATYDDTSAAFDAVRAFPRAVSGPGDCPRL
ncbi:branched-chain amino acid transport system substrate-binding protein [Methylobacterium pseudosasicola]|uniref:Branched-chain amino acid transport system substrate-binding protein n=1 Tax=Methylobacterium pseudosasicola TaxID=582667 RepID=A0A1I4G924_9HYPH|nr:branched-chain amino acid transport system substrate-binding protein [Methylobacterium pseudosasicola]